MKRHLLKLAIATNLVVLAGATTIAAADQFDFERELRKAIRYYSIGETDASVSALKLLRSQAASSAD